MENSAGANLEFPGIRAGKKLEAISKIGFWFKVVAGESFNPQEYLSISRIGNEAPTKTLGQNTFLRWLLKCSANIRKIWQP